MKKYTLSAIALILVIIFVILFEAQDEETAPFIVRAPDGGATLSIPADALLSGGTREDIVIIPISSKDFFSSTNAPTDSTRIYRLEPDGLTFSKPATMVVTHQYDVKKSYAPILLTHSADGALVEAPEITDVSVDEAAGTFSVSGSIKHFSIFISNPEPNMFVAKNEPSGKITKHVGESIAHTFSVTPGKWEYVTHPSTIYPDYAVNVTLEVGNGTRWEANTEFRSPHIISTAGRLTPTEVTRALTNLGATEAYRISTNYTCTTAGEDMVAVVGGTWFHYTLQLTTTNTSDPKPRIEREGRYGWVMDREVLHVTCVVATPPVTNNAAGTQTATTPASPTTAVPAKRSGGVITVCGLPGGPACPKR